MYNKNIYMWVFDVSSRDEYVYIKYLCIYKYNFYLIIF